MKQQRADSTAPLNWSFPTHSLSKGSGVLLLSSSMHTLYISPMAKRLMHAFYKAGTSAETCDVLPGPITRLCQTLLDQLAVSEGTGEWEAVQVQQALTTSQHTILLRGCLLPGETQPEDRRLIVFMERVNDLREEPVATDQVHLSNRQRALVNGLIRGLTNKELAAEMEVSEYTIKEYVRMVMTKTQSSTRYGIIAKVLGLQERPAISEKRHFRRQKTADHTM